MTYRERREARAERLRGWADKREERAQAASETAHQMLDAIPFGQPILVGHHSERADRRYRDRAWNKMGEAVESARKAESMAGRVATIESQLDSSIYDDDPDAVERLEERVAALEAERARIVAFNKTCRKGAPDMSVLDEAQRTEYASLKALHQRFPTLRPDGAFPSYATSNIGGRITKDRQRVEYLRKRQARTAAAEASEIGVTVEVLDSGYARVTFAEKPAREVLDALKGAGFRWAKGSWVGKADDLPEIVNERSE